MSNGYTFLHPHFSPSQNTPSDNEWPRLFPMPLFSLYFLAADVSSVNGPGLRLVLRSPDDGPSVAEQSQLVTVDL